MGRTIKEVADSIEESWQKKLDKYDGASDINISPTSTNWIKKWAKRNNYVIKLVGHIDDRYTYAVAKNQDLLDKHELER